MQIPEPSPRPALPESFWGRRVASDFQALWGLPCPFHMEETLGTLMDSLRQSLPWAGCGPFVLAPGLGPEDQRGLSQGRL